MNSTLFCFFVVWRYTEGQRVSFEIRFVHRLRTSPYLEGMTIFWKHVLFSKCGHVLIRKMVLSHHRFHNIRFVLQIRTFFHIWSCPPNHPILNIGIFKTWLRLIWSQERLRPVVELSPPGSLGDLAATSASGWNCWLRRDHRAIAAYVWLRHLYTWLNISNIIKMNHIQNIGVNLRLVYETFRKKKQSKSIQMK